MSNWTKIKDILCDQKEFTRKFTFFSKNTMISAKIMLMKIEGIFQNMVLKERNAQTSLFRGSLLLGPKTTAKNL